jgi:hypothetical protein
VGRTCPLRPPQLPSREAGPPCLRLRGPGAFCAAEEAAAEVVQVVQVAEVMVAAEAAVLALHLLRQVASAANARDKVPRARLSLW